MGWTRVCVIVISVIISWVTPCSAFSPSTIQQALVFACDSRYDSQSRRTYDSRSIGLEGGKGTADWREEMSRSKPSSSLFAAVTEGGSTEGNVVKKIETLEQLQGLYSGPRDRPVVVRYHATWCQACKKFYPTWTQTAEAYGKFYDFYDVDVTTKRDIIKAMGLTVLPHVHMYRDEKQIESFGVSNKKLPMFLEKLDTHNKGGIGR